MTGDTAPPREPGGEMDISMEPGSEEARELPVLTGPSTAAGFDFVRGIWKENMGLATFFVLFGSSLLVSTFKRFIPAEVRIPAYILIIATFVTIADLVLAAVVPEIHKALGAFIALIVVNCMILGRQEAFASKRPVGRALLDAMGTGIGFIIALLMMGTFRELLGNGSILGYSVFGPNFEPWIVMILPPGGFLTLGFILLWFGWRTSRQEAPRVRRWPHGVAERRAG
jgi:electron transport complex protein RnfE